jgi:hypothetical protein
MKALIFIFISIINCVLYSQNKNECKPFIDVYTASDSLFNEIEKTGIDTIFMYTLYRNSSETYRSKDNSSDFLSSYIFWQTQDSCFIKKINRYTIYKTSSESRQINNNASYTIASIFDYYKAKKQILDIQEFRPNNKDLRFLNDIKDKDTSWLIIADVCSDCLTSTIKYKIGDTKITKTWSTMNFNRDNNKYYIFNLTSELYHWVLITNQVISHPDRNQWWKGTIYKF